MKNIFLVIICNQDGDKYWYSFFETAAKKYFDMAVEGSSDDERIVLARAFPESDIFFDRDFELCGAELIEEKLPKDEE